MFFFLSLSFFLSLALFFRLIPWSIEALCVHLSAQASKTQMGRCSASSLPRETGKALVASVNRTSLLSWGFISSLCKQRNISFYSFLSHSFISFIHSPISSILRVSLDSAEAGPRHLVNIIMSKYFKVHTGACQLKLCWELQHLLKK